MAKLYILIARALDGDGIKFQLGGGSSTPARPKVYASRKQAERYLPDATANPWGGPAKYHPTEIVEVEV